MSKPFTSWFERSGQVVSFFTTDRRRARRFSRRTSIRFRVDREPPQRAYAGGMTMAEMVAEDEREAAR